MAGEIIQLDAESTAMLMQAMEAHLAYTKKSAEDSIKYATQKVLRHLRSHTRKAASHAATKQLEKVTGKQVLGFFPTLLKRNVNLSRDYWVAHSDRAKDNGALIPRWYLSLRRHSKAEAATHLKRQNAGLAKLAWFAGMKKAKVYTGEGGGEASNGETYTLATNNIDVIYSHTALGWQVKIYNKLKYATEGLISPNAVNDAVKIAATQMMQNLKHKLKEKLEKGR